ncbi:MAG: hypothetical protein NTV34_09560 [Proteobacteria bacterium]|nr:hypothetical protein [Pseudomonadota bacterium]
MRVTDPFDHVAMEDHLLLQQKAAWDLETCVDWSVGVDPSKFLLPLDDSAVAFPGASVEQKCALSQLMGLIVNATISEMEDCLPRLKHWAWDLVLSRYPVNPELVALGEQFFLEEAKHAAAFKKYLTAFCSAVGVEFEDLDLLLPKAFGSHFQNAIMRNAKSGGQSFWWLVSNVEEVSVNIFKGIYRNRSEIDPLYFNLHRRHLEEESRHANYAYLMINLMKHNNRGALGWWHRKIDFTFAQIVTIPWVTTELQKFFKVKQLRNKSPWFDVLASCIPLYENMNTAERVKRMFVAAPYVSWIMNPNHRKLHLEATESIGAWILPFPKAQDVPLAAALRGDAPGESAHAQ